MMALLLKKSFARGKQEV